MVYSNSRDSPPAAAKERELLGTPQTPAGSFAPAPFTRKSLWCVIEQNKYNDSTKKDYYAFRYVIGAVNFKIVFVAF
jgi:hypothetical protein